MTNGTINVIHLQELRRERVKRGEAKKDFLSAKEDKLFASSDSECHTVVRNYGMNQNFADVNPERDFQPFDDEKNSHLQTKIS